MAIEHTCGSMAYRLSYQKKFPQDPRPKYFKTNRYYCAKCDCVVKITEGE